MSSCKHNIHIWDSHSINPIYTKFAPIFVKLDIPRSNWSSNTVMCVCFCEFEAGTSSLGLTSQMLSYNHVYSDELARHQQSRNQAPS